MRGAFAAAVFLFAAAGMPAGAHHVSAQGSCQIVAGDEYLASSIGSASICAAITREIETRAPNVPYSVELMVLSPFQLSATLVVEGRTLPEQHFAVTDRNLNASSIQRFAQSLAAEVANAAKRNSL